jgi:hypothetical protein
VMLRCATAPTMPHMEASSFKKINESIVEQRQ